MKFIEYIFTFTNGMHIAYFVLTMSLLLVFLLRDGKYREDLMRRCAHLHLLQSTIASLVVFYNVDVHEVYTVDCIWYNIILALVYLIAAAIFTSKKQQSQNRHSD